MPCSFVYSSSISFLSSLLHSWSKKLLEHPPEVKKIKIFAFSNIFYYDISCIENVVDWVDLNEVELNGVNSNHNKSHQIKLKDVIEDR